VNLDQEIAIALHKAQRLEVETASGLQVWHAWNASAGNPLVLLHGGSGSWNHWVRNVLPLSENRAVWALDTPGLGDSELPLGAEDADDLAEPLAQGMKALFNDEPVDTVGFSFGGLMAGFLAKKKPALIKRMVLVGVPGLGLSNNIPNMRGFRPGMTLPERMAIHRNNLLAIMVHDEKNITPELLAMQEHNVLRDRLRRRRIARSDVLLSVQKHWTCEVHGMWGERDALYEGSLHLIPELLSTCHLKHFDIIQGAGHWVQFEAPDAFNQNLMRYLPIT
jgi:2-hydroxy-6-oxonona-2,4-dienedioate hydrolase